VAVAADSVTATLVVAWPIVKLCGELLLSEAVKSALPA